MSVVQGMSNEWNVMTNQCIAKGCDTHTVVKNIIEIVSETEESLKIGNILCLCTYVTDVCVMMLSRNRSSDVCKIIDVLVDYVIEKKYCNVCEIPSVSRYCVTNRIQCLTMVFISIVNKNLRH